MEEWPAGGMVGFNVNFNLFFQGRTVQEAVHGRDVVSYWCLVGSCGFGSISSVPRKPILCFMLNHHLHEAANLARAPDADPGIQQGFITLTARPTEHSSRRPTDALHSLRSRPAWPPS